MTRESPRTLARILPWVGASESREPEVEQTGTQDPPCETAIDHRPSPVMQRPIYYGDDLDEWVESLEGLDADEYLRRIKEDLEHHPDTAEWQLRDWANRELRPHVRGAPVLGFEVPEAEDDE